MDLRVKRTQANPITARAIKNYQNKTSLELGTIQSPNSVKNLGFFITNPDHETSTQQPI